MASLSLQTSESYLQIGKTKIFYEIRGAGEPVLLLHGGFGTDEDFASQTPELARHFRVVAFERPGHGHSPDFHEEFSFNTMATETIELVEKLNIGPVDIVGWSDGAVVAFLVAITRSDLVRRIVSVGGLFNASSLAPKEVAWLRGATPESFGRQSLLLSRAMRV